jgi:hypothetical protein
VSREFVVLCRKLNLPPQFVGKPEVYGERHKKTCIEQASKLLHYLHNLARLARFERATP